MKEEAKSREKIKRRLKYAATLSAERRIRYWQKLGTKAIFEAAGELRLSFCEKNGIDPRLDKTIAYYSPTPYRNQDPLTK